jgi:hypothetical protein
MSIDKEPAGQSAAVASGVQPESPETQQNNAEANGIPIRKSTPTRKARLAKDKILDEKCPYRVLFLFFLSRLILTTPLFRIRQ